MRRHSTIACVVVALAWGVAAAEARSPGEGWAAFAHGDYVRASRLLGPMAKRGHPRAMTVLGYMYDNGFGVPQSYEVAVDLYTGAAERGDPAAQHLLGLSYDKGHGVSQDYVLAYKWLTLAAAAASIRERGPYLRIRDAVASKMSRNEIIDGQRLALEWQQRPPGSVAAMASGL